MTPHVPSFSHAKLFALLSGALLTAALPVLAEEPPPIPSVEARNAFIQAHQAGLDPSAWSGPARGAHDEYDVGHYDVDLRLNISTRVLTGVIQVQATAEVPDLSQISLDLYSPMIVDAVRVDGNPVSFTHANGLITVALGHTLQPGQAFTVTCLYHGTPSYSGAPFRWNQHEGGVPMVLSYSEPHGAPAWWVCKDDPKDKATFTIHVTAPDTLRTVSNGILESVVQNGDHTATYNWTHGYPMSSYLFSIATTDFQKWTEVYTALDQVRTMNVDYYAYPQDLAEAQVSWSRNIEMMEYYAGIFGEYPFLAEKYAIAEFQHTGAMEHQTATSMGWVWITGTHDNDFVVAHELSHSWVGDMITMREWSHAWTKEGFATLCEALYFESKFGELYYHTYMNDMHVLGYAVMQLYNINPPLHAAIYYKGAWVLHMLRHLIGDEAFFNGIRGYATDPALMYGVSDTETLRAAFEAASGMDLIWFFDEWIYHPGYPKFVQNWQATPAGGGFDIALNLSQVQTVGPIFKMPIDVLIRTDQGDERFVIRDSLFTQSFRFHVDGAPQEVVLDPDDWMILEVLTGTDAAEAAVRSDGPAVLSWPSPFRPPAVIRYALSEEGAARFCVFDASGRLVRTLLSQPLAAGRHEVVWDGLGTDGSPVPSGVYYHRLDQNARSSTGRTVLLR